MKKIERVQRVAIHIIYGNNVSYNENWKKHKIERLSKRREKLCLKFAIKALNHEKFRSWFREADNLTLGQRVIFKEPNARYRRLSRSPIPYFTRLLNKNNGKED